MASPLVKALEERVLIVDGAMGTTIHKECTCAQRDYMGKENCTDVVTLTRPEVIQAIHESFLEAGADVVETNTFGANELVLAEFDLAGRTREMNRLAAEAARAACRAHHSKEKPRFVLGSMGPGTKLITLGNTTWEEMLGSYAEQARGLIEGGADGLIIETCQDLLQVKCAVNACLKALEERGKSATEIPILVSVTIETTGTMLLGTEIAAAAVALRNFPILGLGLNCATGPTEMGEHIAWLAKHWDRMISVIPNAGLPILVEGRTEYPLRPEPFAEILTRYVSEYGVNLVGGCCGTTPAHIAELAKRNAGRARVRTAKEAWEPAVTSLYSPVELKQDASFLIVGERTNANGSKKFRTLLESEDWDGLVSMGKEQIREGSHVIDVCVDYVGRDGVRDMRETAARFTRQVPCALMIDSTDARVIEGALKLAGGKCIVNSINLEDGEKRFDEVCPLLKTFGAAAVALTIDEDRLAGMAKTAERKVEIARRMHELFTVKWGLPASDLLFDPLTFTIATGNEDDRRLALETLDGVERIAKEFPECGIILGVSNVSFGLRPAARTALNSVFLHEAVARGLTAAIVHPSKILPRTKIEDAHWEGALDLIYDRRRAGHDPLKHFIGLFPEGNGAEAKKADARTLPIEERLRRHIIDGEKEFLKEDIEEALGRYAPLVIINEHLLEGMKTVGELFGSGKMQLPFVLESAQVMKAAVTLLEPRMEKSAGPARGKIVLATVKGDVHDIGKNLVDIILSNNGYQVVNLGIKQPIQTILAAWREHHADAIGLSGLLVKSVNVMEENLHELNAQGIEAPVLLGGAALTRHYAEGHLREVYEGPLYYGKDAFEALTVMNALAEGTIGKIEEEIEVRVQRRREMGSKTATGSGDGAGVAVAEGPKACVKERSATIAGLVEEDAAPIPTAPFLGTRVVEGIGLERVYPFINEVALFRGQWDLRKGRMGDREYAQHLEDHARPVYERLKRELAEKRVLQPKVVYGYFPCQSEGNDLVVFDPENQEREVERFTFPRQKSGKGRCIADFFAGRERGERDVIGMFVVTMGAEVSRYARDLFARNEYAEYLYVHGMGVESAEALAELWHQRMRQELGISGKDATEVRRLFQQEYQGSRYSFGYPACPDLADQAKMWRLLNPARIGCSLTDNFQIDPEQSTSAIVVHHPQAKYFNV